MLFDLQFLPTALLYLVLFTDCDASSFPCLNEKCLPKHMLCDGIQDCEDSSDEKELCGMNTLYLKLLCIRVRSAVTMKN